MPAHVQGVDGAIGGMDVALQMRDVPHVILVDVCRSGNPPGDIFEVAGDDLTDLPAVNGINLQSFRWDHVLAFGRWILKEQFPKRITVFLIEGEDFEFGHAMSTAVDQAIDRLNRHLTCLWQTSLLPNNEALEKRAPRKPMFHSIEHVPID